MSWVRCQPFQSWIWVTAAGAKVTSSHWSDGLGVPVFQDVVGSPSMAADGGWFASDDEADAPVNARTTAGPGGSVAGAADSPGLAAVAGDAAADALGSEAPAVEDVGADGLAPAAPAWPCRLHRRAGWRHRRRRAARNRIPAPTTSGSGLRPRRAAGAAASGVADGGATGRVGPDGNSQVGPVAGGGVGRSRRWRGGGPATAADAMGGRPGP